MLTGPTLWPATQPTFRETLETYYQEVRTLAVEIVQLVAESLGLESQPSFGDFCRDGASAVRLLHYPPQSEDSSELQLGTGAHTD